MDARSILLLSGPVAGGKSTVTRDLVNDHRFIPIRSGAYLEALARQRGEDTSRRGLQILGDELDARTDFAWLIDDVAVPLIQATPSHDRWLLDCARKPQQVEHFRKRFGSKVPHLHLVAPEKELRRRYDSRRESGGEYEGGTSYDEAISHPNERTSRALGNIADVTLDTTELGVVSQILARLRIGRI